MKITWIRHASVLIQTQTKTLYLDPYLDPFSHRDLPKANVVLISHPDYDHGTQESVNIISTPGTKVFGTSRASEDINCTVVKEGDVLPGTEGTIAVVKTHNADGVGYLVELGSERIYYLGDTSYDEQLADHVCTILILPIGVEGLLTTEEAVKLVQLLKPKLVIPIHFGMLHGSANDALQFQYAVERSTQTKVVVLDEMGNIEI